MASTTVTLIVTSCAFLIFNIPVDIFFIGYGYGAFSVTTAEDQATRRLFYTAVTLLSYTNNAVNFFIYFSHFIIIIIIIIIVTITAIVIFYIILFSFFHICYYLIITICNIYYYRPLIFNVYY